MTEQLTIDPQENLTDFSVSGSPFERSKDKYSLGEYLEGLYGSWDKIKYELGFQEEDLNSWKDNHFKVLEVGPGTGVSFEQVFDKGVAIYALEPSLKFSSLSGNKARIDSIKNTLLQERFVGRVSAANAADAPYAFPDITFQIAYAIGINFQSHALTAESLVNQIGGVMESLAENEDSFFTFVINEDGQCQYNVEAGIRRSRHSRNFALTEFLENKDIRYDLVKFRDPDMHEQTAIRIYKTSPTGTASEKLNQALHEDLDEYVTPV